MTLMFEPVLDLVGVDVMRGARKVLHDVNLRIDHGERIAILGPNGCGKSTLIKTMTCELYPLASEATRVRIFGRERWDLTELKKRLGVVGNDLPGKLMLRATGAEAVLTGFFSSSTLWPNLIVTAEMRERANEVMELVAATSLRDRRVLIGRALVASSECLLLDEPSNALDLAAQRDLRQLLIALAERGTTLLHITHHIADIIPAMKRVVMMRNGRIVADGPREELLTAPKLSELFGTDVHLAEHDGFFHAW
jgi:iron complex transport system ATP-binding protein